MPVTKQDIIDETRAWPDEAVSDLIDGILLAKHGGRYLEDWNAVARRRLDEIHSGSVREVPGDRVSGRIAGIVGQ